MDKDRFGMVLTELDEIAWLFNLRGEGTLYPYSFKGQDSTTETIVYWSALL